jgi:tetratricopeptide (TPR) repeat protein
MCAVILAEVLVPSAAEAGRNAYAMALAKSGKAEKALAKGDNERAEELFRDCFELEPDFPRPYLGLAAALVGQARFEEALEAVETAKEKYVAWDEEAADLVLERRQEAFQAQQEFETFAGTNAQAVSKVAQNVAHRLESQELLVRDRWDLEEIQRIPSQVYYLQGIAHLRMGHRDEGVNALELCLALNQEHGLAHYNMAVALLAMGQPAVAKEHLDAALGLGVEAHAQFVADLESALQ